MKLKAYKITLHWGNDEYSACGVSGVVYAHNEEEARRMIAEVTEDDDFITEKAICEEIPFKPGVVLIGYYN